MMNTELPKQKGREKFGLVWFFGKGGGVSKQMVPGSNYIKFLFCFVP